MGRQWEGGRLEVRSGEPRMAVGATGDMGQTRLSGHAHIGVQTTQKSFVMPIVPPVLKTSDHHTVELLCTYTTLI